MQGNWRLGTTTVLYLTKNGLLALELRRNFRGGALHCMCPRAPKTLVTPLGGGDRPRNVQLWAIVGSSNAP